MRRAAWVLLLFAAGCPSRMNQQPRYDTFDPSPVFPDGRSARPQVPGTVARGQLDLDEHLYLGKVDGKPATTFPFPITADVMERGHERYNVNCAPCHDLLGTGQGMIVRRGLKSPPSYHIQRLREAPPGYFFDVITNGFGAMYDQRHAIPVRDRWAIIAYIRALQRSRNATLADVPADIRARLEEERK